MSITRTPMTPVQYVNDGMLLVLSSFCSSGQFWEIAGSSRQIVCMTALFLPRLDVRPKLSWYCKQCILMVWVERMNSQKCPNTVLCNYQFLVLQSVVFCLHKEGEARRELYRSVATAVVQGCRFASSSWDQAWCSRFSQFVASVGEREKSSTQSSGAKPALERRLWKRGKFWKFT